MDPKLHITKDTVINNTEGFSFLTTDMLKNHVNLPYTKKEILQQEYPDYWNGANELVRILHELQNLLVELLLIYKKGLPKANETIESKESQDIFLNCLKYKILYAFAETVWKRIEQHCQDIAEKTIDNDSAKMALIHSFEVFDKYPLIDIVSNDEKGFDVIKEMIDMYDSKMDFGVLQRWSYRDIVGTIQNKGITCKQLWEDFLADPNPIDVSIGELLDDNQPMRFY